MATFRKRSQLQNNSAASVGDLISEIGRGVAQAQQQIDAATLESFKAMYSEGDDYARELRSIGYQPTWYHIPEASAEVNLSLSMSASTSTSTTSKSQLFGTTVYATTQNQFNFSSELSSKLSFKVVPVPPPISPDQVAVVPQLEGLTLANAAELLVELGIEFDYANDLEKDSELEVKEQAPKPGSMISRDEKVVIIA